MKKYFLSLGLIIVFVFYVMLSSTKNITPQISSVKTTPITDTISPPIAKTNIPAPIPVPTVNIGKFKNGTFTGSVADAYYGNVQVNAIISGGSLTDVVFLQYPNDRGNSVRINTRAMPILKSEAIVAQSANVDGVSGATATSGAFRQSLGDALTLAAN